MSESDCDRRAARPAIWRESPLWWLLALVAIVHGARLGTLSIRGEEPRRARVAVEMLETGDLVVPRQQGQVYVSRPPLQNWAIAGAASLLGEMNLVAVRLPSLVAVLLTVGLVYWYARSFVEPAAALVAGAAFASMVQVLELGRMAETEALLALLVAASLLVWHHGYTKSWPRAATWSAGYALAALAGLAKGPQGPIYFVAVVGVYLLFVRRDWRMLVNWGHLAGMLTFAAVLAPWVLAFWSATDTHALVAIWGHNAAIRYANPGTAALAAHAAAFPARVLVCTLPWSALFVAYLVPAWWRELLGGSKADPHEAHASRAASRSARPYLAFLLVAVLVTLPSCLTAIEARARYFMPLYPCLALMVAPVAQQVLARGRATFLWFHWLGALALLFLGVAGAMVVATLARLGNSFLVQPPLFVAIYGLVAVAAAVAVFRLRCQGDARAVSLASLAVVALLGLTFAGARINELLRKSADHQLALRELREQLPPETALVSFGRVHHLFAFYYGPTIPALDWPSDPQAVPADVEYFCFEDLAGVAEPELPFAWETVAVVPCDRNITPTPDQKMIIGRRLDAPATAIRPNAEPRR